MSYLTLSGGIPNFSKAVISLWFRAPRESIIAASTSQLDFGEGVGAYVLPSILPLVTFGARQISKTYTTPSRDVAVIHPYLPGEPGAGTRYDTIYYEEGPTYEVDPSYIGLVCLNDGTFSVMFNLQTDSFMSLSKTSYITTRMDIWSGADPTAPVVIQGNGVVSLFPNVGAAMIEDVSYTDQRQPEIFTVQSDGYFEADQWHHLLLSFDISGSVSIGTPFASSDCRLWYAIDDVDYRGAENLRPYRDTGGQWGPDTLDSNAILTERAWRFSGSDPNWEAIQYYQNHFIGLPSGTYDGGSIPSENAAMGLPGSVRYVDGIFRCEMAEFQMWTGVTLDTGVESNRRAFVDEDGKPVDPTKGTPRAPAEKLLGKKPEILLHGSSNWKSGNNTGTLGIEINSDGEETIIPSGQFTPTAKIERYKPDPALEEEPTA